MKLSTRGRYGLRAMLDLALHYDDGYISLRHIAERQEISEGYLEQVFAMLKKDGLVKSVRGAQGGYKLSYPPEDITVGMILRTLEGSLAPVECVDGENPSKCSRYDECVTKFIWEKMRDSLYEVVDSISLEDLALKYKK
ncbi:MAG TPA: Rrf2 family transcriptional regulator [Clostridiales bacterium]|nr:Rrf2 family transcriptional regulator [Clostridiales bacterium]